jgi:hypothetical protein
VIQENGDALEPKHISITASHLLLMMALSICSHGLEEPPATNRLPISTRGQQGYRGGGRCSSMGQSEAARGHSQGSEWRRDETGL